MFKKIVFIVAYISILLVTRSVLATTITHANAAQVSAKQSDALHATEQIWAAWSRDNSAALSYWWRHYSPLVEYYGDLQDRSLVYGLKEQFSERWPERLFRVRPGPAIQCNAAEAECIISGIVDWDVTSLDRGERAVGSAEFTYKLMFSGDSFLIASETGKRLSNKKFNLSGEDASTSQQARVVLSCFNRGGGHWTIEDMFDCSGVWVTPRALMLCALGEKCPVLPDTIVGRAKLSNILQAQNLQISSVLEVDPANAPFRPTQKAVDGCNGVDGEAAFTDCVIAVSTGTSIKSLQDCVRSAEDDELEKAKCLAIGISDKKLADMTECIGYSDANALAVVGCSDAATKSKAVAISQCVQAGDNVAQCFSESLDPKEVRIAGCLLSSSDGSACLKGISSDFDKASEVLECFDARGRASNEAVGCVAGVLPEKGALVAGCLGNPDVETSVSCLLGENKDIQAAQRAYKCISQGYESADLIANCTTDLGLDPTAQIALSCIAKAGSDTSALAACGAGAVLPPDAARFVGCAAESTGAASFALCAGGVKMNEEWRIAAECVVSSGGEPISSASCTASRLTIREITKCFQGEIGKQCFGPNNTIIRFYTNAFNDLTKGPGKNNEVVKALATLNQGLQKLGNETGKFLERPLGSKDALIPKARDDLLDGLGVGGTGRKIIENPLDPRKWF